jgi:hypothetical protein
MNANTWNPPITIENPETGVVKTVGTARQAKAVLDGFWPSHHGSRYRHAGMACDSAIFGEASPCKARQAFIAAAVEAHLRLS